MINNFSLVLSHGLLILTAWLLLYHPDLDDESQQPPSENYKKKKDEPSTYPRRKRIIDNE